MKKPENRLVKYIQYIPELRLVYISTTTILQKSKYWMITSTGKQFNISEYSLADLRLASIHL